ncbi:hypothetical protein MHPYR_110074 [uncultured Mycobacterium sp.]|uniref:HTH tetR-type domain-containing protein n=1 Tax=uncultured Mycobacterium sp. TaxID=171292 RepID=A0A1Y5NYA4_9MYCO|nr:hypothetical protein MHPYR_110074 [uncultured Mycobacterium sp.]
MTALLSVAAVGGDGRRKPGPRSNDRDAIVDAALELFVANGYSSTTLADIVLSRLIASECSLKR